MASDGRWHRREARGWARRGAWALIAWVVAASWGAAASGQDAPPAGSGAEASPGQPKLPQGVVARLQGRDITLDEYVAFLLNSVGYSLLDEYLDRLLVEDAARKQDIVVPRERVEALVAERLDRTIKSLYQGSEERYVSSLKELHRTLDEEKARLRQELYYEALWTALVLKTRVLGQEEIQKEFERLYGEGGVLPVVRHVFLGLKVPAVAGAGKDGAQLRTRSDARAAAEKVLEEIHKGLDFVQAVRLYSEDPLTRENDGRIPHYSKGIYGAAFHEALSSLKENGATSGVVESRLGFHILQLVERQVTRFEDVRADIETHLKERPPSRKELQALIERLRSEAKIEKP